jgi:hypothetical protein
MGKLGHTGVQRLAKDVRTGTHWVVCCWRGERAALVVVTIAAVRVGRGGQLEWSQNFRTNNILDFQELLFFAATFYSQEL